MAFILASRIETHKKDDNGNKIVLPITNHNEILTNLKKYIKQNKRIVWIANNPKNCEENDARTLVCFESFKLSGFDFEEKIVLDKRNFKKAKDIILGADLLILAGGKCVCQKQFFEKIKLKKLLKQFDGLTIGLSAGSMNLCSTVANFPEELADLKEKRWLKGLGVIDKIIIPHFDGENLKYQIECNEIDLINDYVLPMSHKRSLIGIPNDSYYLIDNDGKVAQFGKIYDITNGEVKLLDQNKDKDEINEL